MRRCGDNRLPASAAHPSAKLTAWPRRMPRPTPAFRQSATTPFAYSSAPSSRLPRSAPSSKPCSTPAACGVAGVRERGARREQRKGQASYAMHDEIIQVGIHIAMIASADNTATIIATPARK